MELSTQAVAYDLEPDSLHVTYDRMPWSVVVHAQDRQERYVREGVATATIETETDDGITGRAWCSRCGGSVHRASNYCQHCGARFGPRQGDTALRDT